MTIGFVIYAFLPFAIFLVFYSRVRFWKDAAGWSVFVITTALVIVLGLVLAVYLGWRPPSSVREVVYALVGTAGWVQLAIYLVTRSRFRRDAARTAITEECVTHDRT